MSLRRESVEEFWALSLSGEFSARLDDMRPKLSRVQRMHLVHKAQAAMFAAARYMDEPQELYGYALSALDGARYVRGSKFGTKEGA